MCNVRSLLMFATYAGLSSVVLAASTAMAQVPTPGMKPGSVPGATVPSVRPATDQVVESQPGASRPGQRPRDERDRTFAGFQRQIDNALDQRDLALAVSVAEDQHAVFPNEMKAKSDLGYLYLIQGNPGRAEPLLMAATTLPSTHFTGDTKAVLGLVHTNLAQVALAAGRPADAIRSLQRAIDLAPMNARARYLLATAFRRTGELKRSDMEIKAAFGIDAAAARAEDFVVLADTQSRAGEVTEALATVDRGLKRYPSGAGLRVMLASIRVKQERPGEALEALLYERKLFGDSSPYASEIRAHIAELRAESAKEEADERLRGFVRYLDAMDGDRPEEALSAIREAFAGEDSMLVTLLAADAYVASGRHGQAERLLLKAVDREPRNVLPLVALADLYLNEGRRESAAELLDRAAKLNAFLPAVVEARARLNAPEPEPMKLLPRKAPESETPASDGETAEPDEERAEPEPAEADTTEDTTEP